ncbi:MAG: carbon-nitrogen hydrolase family protein [Planctomycetes bacterium]|nr:carbon-nitrogen hydrolase family protein [Planctomycetota bacterium]
MAEWTIAAVQMDCRLAEKQHNLRTVRARLDEAASRGARLVVFPECVLTGYCFESKEEAWPHAEPVPGSCTEALGADCRRLGTWAIVGLLEHGTDGRLFNASVLVGPGGQVEVYRKIHLPYLGVDRFTTPGDRPFAVYDLGGLRVGMTICYDGSFPESSRVLALLGADLVVLPTNWPEAARKTAQLLVPARALENRIYYVAVNRIGEERGFRFIGQSRLVHCSGDLLAVCDHDREEILCANIDPEKARQKRIVNIPGRYEVDRIGDRRPEMYGPLCRPSQ